MTEEPKMDNLASRFLLLPSLVRDEIYSHLLPETKAIWLGRHALSPYRPIGGPPKRAAVTPSQSRYPPWNNAFRCKRAVEHLAVSHWNPPQTGFPAAPETDYPSPAGAGHDLRGRNGQDVLDLLALRLVCRQVCAEASAYLFRTATLWYTVWDAEVAPVRELVRLADYGVERSPLNEDAVKRLSSSFRPGHNYCCYEITEKDWVSFIQRRDEQDLLGWVSRFRRVSIVLKESHIADAFAMAQAALRRGQRLGVSRRPAFRLVVCGFHVYFDQGPSSWVAYMPEFRNRPARIIDMGWDGAGVGAGATSDSGTAEASTKQEDGASSSGGSSNNLVIRQVALAGEPDYWTSDCMSNWLDAFKFCNAPFRADASFGDAGVDLTGMHIYYMRKNEEMAKA